MLRTSEWIFIGYVLYLAALAWILPLPARRRIWVIVTAVVGILVVWSLAAASTSRASLASVAALVRDWLPAVQILVGYWLSGLFYTAPMPRVEAWLADWDRRLFDDLRVSSFVRRGPRLLLEYLELAYLSVYILVPLGFLLAVLISPGLDVDRYWTLVLTSELASYAMLPWIQTRPPRALGDHMAIESRDLAVRRLNLAILRRGSIQVNTVPSGHAAGALATALAVSNIDLPAGAAMLVLAISVAAGSVVGRYHYVADSVLGALVAIVVWSLA